MPGSARVDGSKAQLTAAAVTLGQRFFGAGACSVALLEADSEHLVFRVATGQGAEQVLGLRIPVRTGIAGYAVSS